MLPGNSTSNPGLCVFVLHVAADPSVAAADNGRMVRRMLSLGSALIKITPITGDSECAV